MQSCKGVRPDRSPHLGLSRMALLFDQIQVAVTLGVDVDLADFGHYPIGRVQLVVKYGLDQSIEFGK